VASVIGAQTNNGTNIAGVDWQARIQPVRVAGRCGALLSDTVDGMRWAGGLSVPGVPDNPTPAHVINISLGGGSCSSAEQNAVNDLNARGVVVVAAAGNNAGAVEAPADCAGVITVTAHVNDGEKASYANFGPAVAISAPGGGCGTSKWNGTSCSSTTSAILTLSNRGATSPGTYFTLPSAGTSFATPTVAGVAALMLAVNGSLAPSQVTGIIKSTARPHPANTFCALAPNTGNCGAGMLDAAGALTLAANTQGTGTAWPTTPATPAAPAATDSGGGGAMPLWSGALLALLGLIGYTLPRRRSHA
jgi:serine protease